MAKKKKSRLGLVVATCVVLLTLVFAAAYAYPYYTYKRDVARIQVQNVDLNEVEDGEYFGACDIGILAARVRVVVREHRIVDLELLEHRHERGTAAEVIPDRIFLEGRIDVDAVTGATNSSKVIQEAMYNAFTGRHTYR